MKFPFQALSLLLLGSFCSHLYASGTLSAAEVRTLFSGKTVTGERQDYDTAGPGRGKWLNKFREQTISRFAEDGTYDEQSGQQHKTGKWRVDGEGHLCTEIQGLDEHCDAIIRRGDFYVRVMRNKFGRNLAQIRYTAFASGAGN